MKVFLVPNYYKTEAVQSGLTLELWLNRQGYDVAWAADQRSSLNMTADIEGSDLVISLGGDGTLLRAVRIVGDRQIPSWVYPTVIWAFSPPRVRRMSISYPWLRTRLRARCT